MSEQSSSAVQNPVESESAVRRVTVLGAGALGAAMAERLSEQGFEVTIWNRTAVAAELVTVTDERIRAVADLREAVSEADVVLTVLRDGPAVLEVMAPVIGALRDGAVWVQASTVGVESAEAARALAGGAGVAYLDAPVSGSTTPARAGKLVWLVAGADSALATARPVLDALGGSVQHVGAASEGSALKLVVNAWMAAATVAATDVLAATRRLGIPVETLTDALSAGPLAMPYVMGKIDLIQSSSFAPGFAIDLALKDVDLLAEAVDWPSDVLQSVRRRLSDAVDAGHGREDIAAVVAVAP